TGRFRSPAETPGDPSTNLASNRSTRFSRGLEPRKAKAREADQHHRPGRSLGNRAADGEVESKAAGPVGDEIVAERQIDRPGVGAKIEDVVVEETLRDRQTSEDGIG